MPCNVSVLHELETATFCRVEQTGQELEDLESRADTFARLLPGQAYAMQFLRFAGGGDRRPERMLIIEACVLGTPRPAGCPFGRALHTGLASWHDTAALASGLDFRQEVI